MSADLKLHYQPGDHRREMFDSLPSQVFLRLDELESLGLTGVSVVYKTKQSLPSQPLEERALSPLPFGILNAVTCAGLVVAYLLEMPPCTVTVGANYAAFSRRSSPDTSAPTLFIDSSLAVLGNSQALLAISPRITWTQR